MTALRLLASLPFRLVAAIAGVLTVLTGAVSIAFLTIAAGFQAIAEGVGGDR